MIVNLKILGYTYHKGAWHFTMKCDSSLLNQKKPFFQPFRAEDIMVRNWAEGTAFDNSLCVGDLLPVEEGEDLSALNDAIARASEKVTLRNGDLIFVDREEEALPIQREQVIEESHLYCKIK